MKKPKRSNRTPPCGWEYVTTDGSRIIGFYLRDLVNRVAKYYTTNEMEFDSTTLEAEILDQICSRLPDDWCVGEGSKTFHPTTDMIEKGTRAVLTHWLANKSECEDDVVAMERASVCLTLNGGKHCHYYRRQPTCWSCTALYKLMSAALGANRMRLLENAHVCGICKCGIGSIAYVKANVLAAGTTKEQVSEYPEECWKRKELERYYSEKQ